MSIDQSVNDLLTAGAPTAKFDVVGKVVRGRVEAATVADQTDIKTGTVKTWQDGSARKQLVITILTEERDPTNSEDDGRRRLFAKSNMFTAIREAVKKTGGQLQVGGKLAVQYTGDGEQKEVGLNAPKLFKAQYEPPAQSVSTDDLL